MTRFWTPTTSRFGNSAGQVHVDPAQELGVGCQSRVGNTVLLHLAEDVLIDEILPRHPICDHLPGVRLGLRQARAHHQHERRDNSYEAKSYSGTDQIRQRLALSAGE